MVFDTCLARFGSRHRHMATIDADEVGSTTDPALPRCTLCVLPSRDCARRGSRGCRTCAQYFVLMDKRPGAYTTLGPLLDEYYSIQPFGGLVVAWVPFGSSGHIARPRVRRRHTFLARVPAIAASCSGSSCQPGLCREQRPHQDKARPPALKMSAWLTSSQAKNIRKRSVLPVLQATRRTEACVRPAPA